MREQQIYFNAFNQINQVGPVRMRKLINSFGTLENAWQAGFDELKKTGLEEPIIYKILEVRPMINPQAEFDKLASLGIRVVAYADDDYPKLLQEIPASPLGFYVRGDLNCLGQLSIAVVGSRKMSAYGQRVTESLVHDLSLAGMTIVSGLALGTDSIAHKATLSSGGKTVAVLACGLDSIYPSSNRYLAQQILEGGGAIISEFPLGTPPLKHHFPNRNRIIAGLSLGTIVVEAALESGALITASHAVEQNRQVFAVPGSIYSPVSAGPHNLLKMGAKLVAEAADVLEDLNINFSKETIAAADILPDNEEEQKILDLLTSEPREANELTKLTNLPAGEVAATLTIMEMKGKVRNLGGNQYVKGR